jgi:lipid-binding SYLF domain-containing protein
MKRTIVLTALVIAVATLTLFGTACSRQEATQQAEAPAAPSSQPQAAEQAGETATDEPEWKTMKQQAKATKIDDMADEALEELFTEHPRAKDLYAKAYGWAAFDNLKLAVGVSGGGGNGVAVNKQTGERTYMKMGTGGVGLGIGANKYQIVFLFQDETTFSNFVTKGWQADAGATAAAGVSAAEVKTDFVNGLAIYQMTEKGLMLNADIAGTKYWKNKKLND